MEAQLIYTFRLRPRHCARVLAVGSRIRIDVMCSRSAAYIIAAGVGRPALHEPWHSADHCGIARAVAGETNS